MTRQFVVEEKRTETALVRLEILRESAVWQIFQKANRD